MLLSMTGYGRASMPYKEKMISVEVRSLNSKYTDLRIRFPQNYREKEVELRKMVSKYAERGKIDINVEVKSEKGDEAFGLNKGLFRRYFHELNDLATELNFEKGDMLQAILRIPNVVANDEESIDDEEWEIMVKTMNAALKNFGQYREAEGQAMENDLRERISIITSLLHQLDPFEEERVTRLRQRLSQNLEEYLGKDKIDENRFEQEILFYLEKIDITEEKVRLEQHCKYFLEELDKPYQSKGRKLNFIGQEMGREINTMGAKAYSSNIQRLVVGMKDELEKVKEQIANSL
ncbi:MAG: YicC/YloC family endoribonuclease [Saprospiraceae bacterium]